MIVLCDYRKRRTRLAAGLYSLSWIPSSTLRVAPGWRFGKAARETRGPNMTNPPEGGFGCS